MPRPRMPANPFRYFHSSPEVIRLVVIIAGLSVAEMAYQRAVHFIAPKN